MRNGRNRRGAILLLAIFFLMVLFFMAMALLQLLPVEMNATQRHRFNLSAYYAADAGITEALAWLEDQLEQDKEPSLSFTRPTGSDPRHEMAGALGEWTWTVEIRPDAMTPPRGTSGVRMYEIASTAWLGTTKYRKVTVTAGQESFAKYGLFYDQGDSGLVWDVGNNRISGPMHQNDVLRLWVPSGYFQSEGDPAFLGSVTSDDYFGEPGQGDGVDYVGPGGKPYDQNGSPDPDKYRRMLTGGRESLRTGEKTKEMPINSRNMADAAWGSTTSSPPSAPGVYLNSQVTSGDFGEALGGVFIRGDVDKMQLGVSNGNSTVKIKQGSNESTVTVLTENGMSIPSGAVVNGAAVTGPVSVPVGHTVIKNADGSYVVAEGETNGLVYCTGDIANLSGTNKGPRTVAVDIETDKAITIGGDLYRSDTTVGEAPDGSDDALGVVGYNVRLSKDLPRTPSDPLYLYCTIFAGRKDAEGGLEVEEWWERHGEVGTFIIHGGLIEGQDKPWGYVGTSGFASYEINYDPALALTPPPYFPMLPKLLIRSWTEEKV